MPEPETFDLDSAFARLERDIAGVSSPRGAGLAVRTARRRRRTTFGAVAAVALLAVGGVAVAQGIVRDSSSIAPSDHLPAPAPFDDGALTAATAGWSSAWSDPTKADQHAYDHLDLGCLDHIKNGVLVDPERSGDIAAVNSAGGLAFGELGDFGTKAAPAATTWDALSTGMAQCSGVTTAGHLSWTDGEAMSFTVAASKVGAADQHVWLAREGNAFGLLWIADQPGAVPDAVDTYVMEAMVAGLQSPASYQNATVTRSGSSSASASASGSVGPALATVSDTDLADALGTWPNQWSRTAGSKVVADLPSCAQDWATQEVSGESAAIGLNGVQEFDGFDSAAHARASMDALTTSLRRCTSPGFASVQTQASPTGNTLLVASGAAGDDVVWAVQVGPTVAFLVVPGSGTPPPDAVSQKVAALLEVAARQPANDAGSTVAPSHLGSGPDPSGTVSSSSTAPSAGDSASR